MSSPYEIQRRIRSLRNIAKIAEAIQMATGNKVRRAQERAEQSRPYSEQLRALVSRLARVTGEDMGEEIALFKQRPVRGIGFVVIGPDRGLAGALPSNINHKAATTALDEQRRFEEQGERPSVEFVAVGRKARDFVICNELHMIAEFTNYGDRPSLGDATAIAQVATDAFLKGEVDVVYLIYAKFVNTVTQQPTAFQLLPVQPPPEQEGESRNIEYIYEPDPATIYEALLPRYVDVQVYQALLQTVASEYSARIVAMTDVLNNADELIDDLTSGL